MARTREARRLRLPIAANLVAVEAGIHWPGLAARAATAAGMFVHALARMLAWSLARIGALVSVLFVVAADGWVVARSRIDRVTAATKNALVTHHPRWRVAARDTTRKAAQWIAARSALAGKNVARAASATGIVIAQGLHRSARRTQAALRSSAVAVTERASIAGRTTGAAFVHVRRSTAVAARSGFARLANAGRTALRTIGRAIWVAISYPPLVLARGAVALAQATRLVLVRTQRATADAIVGFGRGIASAPARARGAVRRRASQLAVCPACGYRLSVRSSICSICGELIGKRQAKSTLAATASIGSSMLAASGRILLIALYCASLVLLVAGAVILGAVAVSR